MPTTQSPSAEEAEAGTEVDAPPTPTGTGAASPVVALSVSIPAPQCCTDADDTGAANTDAANEAGTAADAAAVTDSPPQMAQISQSPTGAYVNPAMRKMLERQRASVDAAKSLTVGRINPGGDRSQDSRGNGRCSIQAQADKPMRKSSSLANMWPFKNKGAGDDEDAPEEAAGADKNDPSSASKSDPAKIVLARVGFLLENEADVLPAYHVFNSNSECIAVWCKTGRWSSLQSDVFWHTTAIGNAKSTTLMGLSLAATQPWLIPALPVAAVAAIGTPYLVLHQSKKKCEEATKQLTDGFWAQASNEVYVEAVETWSGLA